MIKKLILETLNKAGYDLIKLSPDDQKNEAKKVIDKGDQLINQISPDFQILNGPFKGMKYPSIDITEATLVPKIVGSYESQLNPVIYQILDMPYVNILDIGCAEGYYAVGFARLMRNTTIHCFDINQSDLEFCKLMAECNDVQNLTYNNLCTPDTLLNFEFKGKSLIFCDCEGYELELFTAEVINKLKDVDVLVELHDVINPVISSEITTRFQHTHNIQIINNLNVDNSHLKGLERLSEEDRQFSIFEHRGGLYQNIFMEWAFLTAKTED